MFCARTCARDPRAPQASVDCRRIFPADTAAPVVDGPASTAAVPARQPNATLPRTTGGRVGAAATRSAGGVPSASPATLAPNVDSDGSGEGPRPVPDWAVTVGLVVVVISIVGAAVAVGLFDLDFYGTNCCCNAGAKVRVHAAPTCTLPLRARCPRARAQPRRSARAATAAGARVIDLSYTYVGACDHDQAPAFHSVTTTTRQLKFWSDGAGT